MTHPALARENALRAPHTGDPSGPDVVRHSDTNVTYQDGAAGAMHAIEVIEGALSRSDHPVEISAHLPTAASGREAPQTYRSFSVNCT